jgi:hypothetical protein
VISQFTTTSLEQKREREAGLFEEAQRARNRVDKSSGIACIGICFVFSVSFIDAINA